MGLPWLNYLLVNAPDPYLRAGLRGTIWTSIPAPGIERSLKLLFELLDTLRGPEFSAGKDGAVFGFSQGCLMCHRDWRALSHRLAGIVGSQRLRS